MGLESSPPPPGRPAPNVGEATLVENRAGSLPPEPQAASPSAPATDLPPIAAKAEDLEAIKKAVDDAASVGGGLWLSYLFVLFYLAVAAGAVTHADLFFEKPVKLPFLNIELPLLAFFTLAPILFLIVHAYTLVHLVFLTDKAARFHQVLLAQIDDAADLPENELIRRASIRAGLRRQLPSNIFVQFLAGPLDIRDSPFGRLLRAIAWLTLVIAAILLLLLMQIQFLPFHSSFITWTQRIVLILDLGLLSWLWPRILSVRKKTGARRIAAWVWPGLSIALGACALLFSWVVSTFPGEWQEDHLPSWRVLATSDEMGQPTKASLHDWIFNSKVDQTTRRRWLPFSNTLVLVGLNIYEGLGIDDPEKAKWHDFIFRARGRDLTLARFDFASLGKVDFTGAELGGASFDHAQLQGASFDRARLQAASFNQAQLQRASLVAASLQGAYLQSASIENAQLQGASLDDAQLQFASLAHAQLQGASLNSAQLQGVLFDGAQLQGASLNSAQLHGASFAGGQLKGVSLQGAQAGGPADDVEFQRALAAQLRTLVCSGASDAVDVLRRLVSDVSSRFAATGAEAPALVDFVMSRDCPASASLTEADKTNLLRIKQNAAEK